MLSDEVDIDLPPALRTALAQGHLSPTQVGELVAAAGVDTVILYHYDKATEEDLRKLGAVFDGRIIAGEDLMEF